MAPQHTHESLASIPEGDLVRRILGISYWRERLLNIDGIPLDALWYAEVPLQSLGKKGDIDILVVSPAHPEDATVFQVKRIKVTEQSFRTGKPNRLADFKELQRQTNLLVDLGFARVFCYVIVVVDSRAQNKGDYRFDGLTTELNTIIYDSLKINKLDANAGFIIYEIVQPIDDQPLGTGIGDIQLCRMPTVRQQPPLITDWVKNFIEKET